ncbi:ribosome biogenesis GTP-binding protein YihA/YsxC [Kiloniella sp. b19]|uniref:ribosome biogenesis GTP-binding protein YihA/YsxC n=1 Tax=Kiloniella sp. GXU_MW_B19 TaxID=3141326 RepID=UPI0031DC7D2B
MTDFEQDELERGRILFTKPCTFVLGAQKDEHLKAWGGLPEIAFAGRSNVGKSSLVNALTNRKTLARTSNTPGRTQQLNFFNLGDRLVLVDLPGYGFAQASKANIEHWTKLTRNYLRGRAELARVMVLIDSRHGPKDVDRKIMDELDTAAVSYQVILTKTDKTKKADLDRILQKLSDELMKRPAAHPEILQSSSAKGDGVPEIRASMLRVIEQMNQGH